MVSENREEISIHFLQQHPFIRAVSLFVDFVVTSSNLNIHGHNLSIRCYGVTLIGNLRGRRLLSSDVVSERIGRR